VLHSSKTFKRPTKKLPTYAGQSAVKVNLSRWGGGGVLLHQRRKREGRENQIGTEFFEAGFSNAHSQSFLTDNK
jgi:hypothetical protein